MGILMLSYTTTGTTLLEKEDNWKHYKGHIYTKYMGHRRKCIDKSQRQATGLPERSKTGEQEASKKTLSKASTCRPHQSVHIK